MFEKQKEQINLKEHCADCGKQKAKLLESGPDVCNCAVRLVQDPPSDARPANESALPAAKSSAVRLDGYDVCEKLGEGGMGQVYKARLHLNGADAAVKFMKADAVSDRVALKRFEQEARAVSELTHPNIAQVFGYGVKDEKQPYLLMEFVDGLSLSEILHHDRSLRIEYVLEVFSQIVAALEHAHAKGVIHRDIKPSNILVVEDRNGNHSAKLLDFGIAKVAQHQGAPTQLTQPADILGSPSYMSPEQCQGDTIDHRSDIYSLGCVMFEALAGQSLFEAENPIKTMLKHINSSAKPRLEVLKKRGIPRDLVAMIEHMLERNPKNRYQTMTQIREDLARVANGQAPHSIPKRKEILRQVSALVIVGGLCASVYFWAQLVPTASPRTSDSTYASTTDHSARGLVRSSQGLEPNSNLSDLKNIGLSAEEHQRLQKLLSIIAVNEGKGDYRTPVNEAVSMGDRIIPTLCEALKQPGPENRASGLVLMSFKDVAVPYLVKTLKESAACEVAIWLPMKYNGRAGLLGVSQLLSDPDSEVRARAARVLKVAADYQNFSSDIRGELELPVSGTVSTRVANAVINDSNPKVRTSAVEALTWATPSDEVNKAFASALKSDSPELQAAAASAVVRYMARQSAEYNKELSKLMEGLLMNSDDEQAKLAMLKSVKDARGAASVPMPVMKKLLKDRSNAVRKAAIEAVGEMGSKSVEALPELISCLDDSTVRESAAYAIAHYGDEGKSALPKLEELAKNGAGGGVSYAIDCISGKYAQERHRRMEATRR